MYKNTVAVGMLIERWFYSACGESEGQNVLYHKINSDWNRLMEPSLAACSKPLSISFYKEKTTNGVLWVEVTNPSAAMIIKAQEHAILNKLAQYFGYKAIVALRIKVSPVVSVSPTLKPTKQLQSVDDVQTDIVYKALTNIEDEELRELLASIAMNSFDLK